ncbi:MAG: hypothetical protein Q4G04_00660 [bacterium]|nr:hypothetical protein [bacterium]
MKKYLVDNKKNVFLIILVMALVASITLFISFSMAGGHDLNFHLSRIMGLRDAFKLGMFPIKVYPSYLAGYGYGNGLFYPDLFLYIPAFLSSLGLDITISYKIFIFLINFFAGYFMYISVKGISKNHKTALLATLIYMFSSYRLIDLYTRAALGESLAFVFAPLVLYGFYKILYENYKEFYILVIGMTGVILSHIISTYLLVLVLFIVCIFNIKKFFRKKERFIYLLLCVVVTFLLTAYFTVPMLEQTFMSEFVFTRIDTTVDLVGRAMPIWALFVALPYEFIRPWIPAGIGLIFWYFIYSFIRNKKTKIKNYKFIKMCMLVGLLSLLCSTLLFPWWSATSLLAPIQFPWRLFFVATVFLTMGGSMLVMRIKDSVTKRKIITWSIVVSLIGLIGNVCVSFVTTYHDNKVGDTTDYAISYGEYLPSNANRDDIVGRGDKIISSNPIVFNFVRDGLDLKINFSANNYEDTSLELPLLYYVGYKATIDGNELDVYKADDGLVGIKLGGFRQGEIEVSYSSTNITFVSMYISIITGVIFVSCILAIRGRKKDEKN